jgi:hypothetical protein
MKAFLEAYDFRKLHKKWELKTVKNGYVIDCPKWPTTQIWSLEILGVNLLSFVEAIHNILQLITWITLFNTGFNSDPTKKKIFSNIGYIILTMVSIVTLKASLLYNIDHNKCKELFPTWLQFKVDKNLTWTGITNLFPLKRRVCYLAFEECYVCFNFPFGQQKMGSYKQIWPIIILVYALVQVCYPKITKGNTINLNKENK